MAVVMNDKIVAVMFIGLLMVGGLMGFLMFSALDNKTPEPWEESHSYTVTGTLNGSACSGSGVCEYVDETQLAHMYSLKMNFSNTTGSKNLKFTFAFETDGTPKSVIYTKVGTETVSGMNITIVSAVTEGVTYTYYTGADCTIQKVTASAEDFSVVCTMDGGVYA